MRRASGTFRQATPSGARNLSVRTSIHLSKQAKGGIRRVPRYESVAVGIRESARSREADRRKGRGARIRRAFDTDKRKPSKDWRPVTKGRGKRSTLPKPGRSPASPSFRRTICVARSARGSPILVLRRMWPRSASITSSVACSRSTTAASTCPSARRRSRCGAVKLRRSVPARSAAATVVELPVGRARVSRHEQAPTIQARCKRKAEKR